MTKFVIAALILSFTTCDHTFSQESTAETTPWRVVSDAAVREYRVEIPKDKTTRIKMLPDPIFIHNYNVDYESHALVYLWTNQVGRPVAAVTAILNRSNQDVDQWDEIDEFHSFHDASLVTTHGRRQHWAPTGPGVDWVEVSDAPKPAATEKLQAIQAKSISRRFTVTAVYNRTDGRPWELRLITTPVHRYSTKDGAQLVSGALHFFCKATDPEAMLALEVRKNENGEYRWHYAPANYSAAGVHFKLDEEEVWSDDPASFGPRYRHYGTVVKSGFSLAEEFKKIKSADN